VADPVQPGVTATLEALAATALVSPDDLHVAFLHEEEDKRTSLSPEHEVLREIEGIDGEVEVEILYDPRPDYGLICPVLEWKWDHGLRCEVGGAALILRSELPLELEGDGRGASGVVRVKAGERKYLSLTYSREAPAGLPLLVKPLARGSSERLAGGASGQAVVHTRDPTATPSCAVLWH
jgi:hypothetical protein